MYIIIFLPSQLLLEHVKKTVHLDVKGDCWVKKGVKRIGSMEVEQVIANLEKRVESEKRGDRDSGGNHNSVQYCTNLYKDLY